MHTYTVSRRRFGQFGLAALLMALAACTTVKPPEVVVQPEVPQVPAPKKVPKLGLALGGGAARGFAHIGVIQVLEENGIKPDMVKAVGVSGMVPAVVLLDADGELLRPSIQQSDGRCAQEVDSLRREFDEAEFTQRTGNGINQQLLRSTRRHHHLRQSHPYWGQRLHDHTGHRRHAFEDQIASHKPLWLL